MMAEPFETEEFKQFHQDSTFNRNNFFLKLNIAAYYLN